jgi:DNA replication protein DnaC
MSAPAKTQALEALVEAHARELHLPAIRQRFRGLAAEAVREQQTPLAYLAALLEAEVTERAERREKRRLLDARFPIIKRLEDFRFADNPKVPQATIATLAEGSWIDDRESVILIGESGTGKTMLATALGVCACQQGRRAASPHSPASRPSSKRPTAAKSSPGSWDATPASTFCCSMSWATWPSRTAPRSWCSR